MMIGIGIVIGILLLVVLGLMSKIAADSRNMSVTLGLENGSLRACPLSPNCVSSDAEPDDNHFIEAIPDEQGSKWSRLITQVSAMEGATLINAEENYIYFTFSTKLMGFVDDVEFYRSSENVHNANATVISVRSASRVGQSDMNVNRQRIEAIRSAL